MYAEVGYAQVFEASLIFCLYSWLQKKGHKVYSNGPLSNLGFRARGPGRPWRLTLPSRLVSDLQKTIPSNSMIQVLRTLLPLLPAILSMASSMVWSVSIHQFQYLEHTIFKVHIIQKRLRNRSLTGSKISNATDTNPGMCKSESDRLEGLQHSSIMKLSPNRPLSLGCEVCERVPIAFLTRRRFTTTKSPTLT